MVRLLDGMVMLVTLSILAAAFAGNRTGGVSAAAARRTALEMHQIQIAAKRFRRDTGGWPADVDELRAAGYLPASFGGESPWGTAYRVQGFGEEVTVSCRVPERFHGPILELLPGSASHGEEVWSTVPRYGREPVFTKYLHREGEEELRTMEDDLLMEGHRMREVAPAVEGDDVVTLGQADGTWVRAEGDTVSGPLSGDLRAWEWTDRDDPSYRFRPGGGSRLALVQVDDIWYPHLGRYASQLLDRPSNWDCRVVSGTSSVCCPAGYTMLDTAGSRENSSGCRFWTSGGVQCAHCFGPTYAVCCR